MFITLLIPGSKVTKLWESNILRKVVMRIKSGPCVTTSAASQNFRWGPRQDLFLNLISIILKVFLLRSKQEHEMRTFGRYVLCIVF